MILYTMIPLLYVLCLSGLLICALYLFNQLAELQKKVRSEVSAEYRLRLKCVHPEQQLFDWGMTRLRRPFYGVGNPFAGDSDDQIRKKRDAEVRGDACLISVFLASPLQCLCSLHLTFRFPQLKFNSHLMCSCAY